MSTYSLDLTGLLLSNKVINEPQAANELNARGFYFIIPQYGPFFENNLVVKNTVGGVTTTLVKDTDYFLGTICIGVSASTSLNVYSSIVLHPDKSTGTFSITYQALGGVYETDPTAFIDSLSQMDINPLKTSWEQVSAYPTRYPDTPTPWYQQDLVGQEDLVNKLHGLEKTIITTATQNLQNRIIDIDGDLIGSGTVTIPVNLNNTGVAPGAYVKITVNQQGLVTAASNVANLAELGITEDYTTTVRAQELMDLSVIPKTHIGAGGAEHAVATTTTAGFMSAADKVALNAAQYYAASNTAASALGVASAGVLAEMARSDHVHPLPSNATTTTAGLMSAADKTKLDGIATGAQANVVTSVFTRTGAVVLTGADLGLADVDNTSDASKPVSTAQQAALDDKQDLIFDYYKTDAQIQALPVASNVGKIAKASDTRKEYICNGTTWVVYTAYSTGDPQLARSPVPIYPLTGDETHIYGPTLSAYAFSPVYTADTRIRREFEITLATDTEFASPVDSFNANSNSAFGSVTLNTSTAYIWRCRDVYNCVDTSNTAITLRTNWSDTQSFTTYAAYVVTPTFTGITGDPNEVTETPTITMSNFLWTPGGGQGHASTTWEILDETNTVIYTNAADAVNKTSWTIPEGVLDSDSIYTVTAVYHSDLISGGSPVSSSKVSKIFNTMRVFPIKSYVAVASDGARKLTIYKQDIDTFSKLADPATLPNGSFGADSCAFSPDGNYLAVGQYGTPFIYIYKRSGDTFAKLPDPVSLPTNGSYGCSFSPDGNYLVTGSLATPFVFIYKRSGDTFTKLSDPTTLPAGSTISSSFSPSGDYLVIGHNVTPFITIYKRSGDTFTKLSDPAVLPASRGNSVAFSPDNTHLIFASNDGATSTVYKRSGDTFTKLTNLVNNGQGYGVSFTPDGNYVMILTATEIYIFSRTGDTFTSVVKTWTTPVDQIYSGGFSPDGKYAIVSTGNSFGSKKVYFYKHSAGVLTLLAEPVDQIVGLPYSTAWYMQGYGEMH